MDTIFSLVTKPINQNIAVIRLSGPETFSIVKRWFKLSKNTEFLIEANTVNYHQFNDLKQNYIDEGLLLTFKGPNSFTGEDIIEIQTHGSMFVVNKILTLLEQLGARQSVNGEFMQQAFINGKIDLTKSEAINQLILTDNKQLALSSSQNIAGRESKVIKAMITELNDVLARIQIGIDYPENNDLPEYNIETIKSLLTKKKLEIEKIIDDSQRLINVSSGIKVAFIGKPNTGKSTLLNSILKQDRAIVSNQAGTTRDVIESDVYINGIRLTLQDTAGLRITKNKLEQQGINKTKEIIKNADICVILIASNSNSIEADLKSLAYVKELNTNLIYVFTKSDLKTIKQKQYKNFISIAAKNNEIEKLLKQFEINIEENFYDEAKAKNNLLISQNQINQFQVIFEHLTTALNLIYQSKNLDLIVFELEDSLTKLNALLGITKDINYLNNLFSNFCLGK